MHGRHVARHGANGDHKYHEILQTLAKKDLIVIGWVSSDTGSRNDAKKVIGYAQNLLNAGVPAKNITIAEHSRGGMISMVVSSRLQNTAIKYGILAGCGVEGSEFRRSYMRFIKRRANDMQGRFLVAWDADDDVTLDCDLVMKKAGVEYRNLEFKTGGGHRLFYKPEPIWIDPVVKFALSD